MPVQRRLAAILAADVAGYSRLMGEDEEGTLATLTAHLTELIEPCIAEHRGRVVKTTGDGLLADFADPWRTPFDARLHRTAELLDGALSPVVGSPLPAMPVQRRLAAILAADVVG